MDRLHEIEVFIAVADAGSFAKAGARLRLSPPAVTRAISALEDRLGARVFNRTTRSLTITDVGRRFLESARRVLTDLESAEKEAVGETGVPQGHLTVTASVTFGRSALAPIVCSFLAQHPRVSISVLLLDRMANLVEEGIVVREGGRYVPPAGGAGGRGLCWTLSSRRSAPCARCGFRRGGGIRFVVLAGRRWGG
mgnify:CR=1 FL=1